MLKNRTDAYQLLQKLGAPERLLTHVRLVGEAADILMQAYDKLELHFDAQLIELGVAVHDAGKIEHPQELNEPGAQHESAGEAMLLAHGVQAEVAKCCITHAAWHGADVSLEEQTVALADKLWKGKREEALELKVIDEVLPGWELSAGTYSKYWTPHSNVLQQMEHSAFIEANKVDTGSTDCPEAAVKLC